MHPESIFKLAALQGQILHHAAVGVRPGGTLAYSVCTITPAETVNVTRAFLDAHPAFKLDPFPHPIDGSATGRHPPGLAPGCRLRRHVHRPDDPVRLLNPTTWKRF